MAPRKTRIIPEGTADLRRLIALRSELTEARGVARSLGTSMHSMPAGVFASLLELGHLRIVPHLGSVSLAARLGFMRRLTYLGRILQLTDSRIDEEGEATLFGVDVWASCRMRSLSVELGQLWRVANEVGLWAQLMLRMGRINVGAAVVAAVASGPLGEGSSARASWAGGGG